MTREDTNPRRDRSRTELVLDFLARIRWIWGPLLVIVAIGFLSGTIPVPIDLGPSMRTIVASAIVTLIVGYIPAKQLVHRLYRRQMDTIVTVDPADRQRIIDAWYIHPETMQSEVDVVEGELQTQPSGRGTAYIARSFDPEAMEAEGVWLGELGGVDLLRERNAIEQNRLRNHQYAQAGIEVLVNMDTIVSQIATEYTRHLLLQGYQMDLYGYDKVKSVMDEIAPELMDQPDDLETNTDQELGDAIKTLTQDLAPGQEVSVAATGDSGGGDTDGEQ